jgi:hypothetical protein
MKLRSLMSSRSSRFWRTARWGVLAASIPALWACTARKPAVPSPKPEQTFNDLFQQSVNRNIDIVFMVDNSSSMTPLQNKLTTNFPAFMDVLKNLPGGLPNVHIGVVSSSMGAGRNPSVDHCPPGGDQGVFQTAMRGTTCAAGSLQAGQNFIINNNGMPNYTGDISDVFSCIAALGDQGCGFEHQFESVLRALGADGAAGPPQNANFLRADAYLAIILITNEDDCSAPPDSDLFDSTSQTVSDPLGPLQSYRCNEFGHLCGGHAPPRTPAGPTDLSGTCMSAEDGRLLRVSDVVTAMKRLKADPTKVLVAAIAGPPSPYVVNLAPAQVKSDPNMWPYVQHSCMAADGTYADPSIRIQQWINAFGNNGVFEEICNDSFKPALTVIANQIGKKIGAPCVYGNVLDADGNPWMTGAAMAPDCAVVDHQQNASGNIVDTMLPPCPDMAAACTAVQNHMTVGTQACWALCNPGAGVCTGGPAAHIMSFNRPGAMMTTDLNSSVSCSVVACPPAGVMPRPAGC